MAGYLGTQLTSAAAARPHRAVLQEEVGHSLSFHKHTIRTRRPAEKTENPSPISRPQRPRQCATSKRICPTETAGNPPLRPDHYTPSAPCVVSYDGGLMLDPSFSVGGPVRTSASAQPCRSDSGTAANTAGDTIVGTGAALGPSNSNAGGPAGTLTGALLVITAPRAVCGRGFRGAFARE